ncbi:hypothetical protein BJ165DRAFT_1523240 [Panaeolus papilionaceus]|nr:hypothetical protein BJ165DRAFT_1523240 [Panaeolus papilionaceus]
MVHPGAFSGSRKVFLASQAEDYEAGIQGGYTADAVAVITRKYFKRYPVWLDHDAEPSPEFLQKVDDDAPDEEYPEPDPDIMSPEEYDVALKEHEERNKLIQFRKAQIKRRLAYQYLRTHDLNQKESRAENPYFALLCKLSGSSAERPIRKPPSNFWRKTATDEIKTEVDRRATSQHTSRKNGLAGLRSTVTKQMFNKLPADQKEEWDRISKEEHAVRLEEWEKRLKTGPSDDPNDRQRCIESLIRFVQPILDGICSATGWKATLIAGGPEPACAGGLSIISVHSGTTSGEIKMNFGRAESARFAKYIAPIFTDFLKKSYSVEECKSQALPSNSAFEGLTGTVEEEQGVNLFSLGLPLQSAPQGPSAASPTPNPAAGPPSFNNASALSPLPLNGIIYPAPPPPNTQIPLPNAQMPPPNTASVPVNTPTRPPPLSSPPASPLASPCRSPPASPPFIDSPPHSPIALSFSPLLPSHVMPTVQNQPPPPSTSMDNASTSASILSPNAPPISVAHLAIPPRPTPPLTTTPTQAAVKCTPPPRTDHQQPVVQQGLTMLVVSALPLQTLATQDPGTSEKRKRADTIPNNQPMAASGTNTKKTRIAAPSKAAIQGPSNPLPRNIRVQESRKGEGGSSVKGKGGGSGKGKEKENATPSGVTGLAEDSSTISEPKWFTEWLAVFRMESKDLGPKKQDWMGLGFHDLLNEWEAFEKESRFEDRGRLSAVNRPDFIHTWIKNARKTTFRPAIQDVMAAQRDFKAWWDGLQPAWRRRSDGTVNSRQIEGDWSSLHLPGINGLFSAVTALFFIGSLSYLMHRTRAPWTYAVDDVTEALRQLRAAQRAAPNP